MEVVQIYCWRHDKQTEFIYQLHNDKKIIKRDSKSAKKLNIAQWDEVNYIPDYFETIDRKITADEKRGLNRYLCNNHVQQKSFWNNIKLKLKQIFVL